MTITETATPTTHTDPHPTTVPAMERVRAPGNREKLAAANRRLAGCTARMEAGLARLAVSA